MESLVREIHDIVLAVLVIWEESRERNEFPCSIGGATETEISFKVQGKFKMYNGIRLKL